MAKKKKYYAEKTVADRDMIHSDYSKMSNLPTEVIMKKYATGGYYENSELKDNISGVDDQMKADITMIKRHKSDSKY